MPGARQFAPRSAYDAAPNAKQPMIERATRVVIGYTGVDIVCDDPGRATGILPPTSKQSAKERSECRGIHVLVESGDEPVVIEAQYDAHV